MPWSFFTEKGVQDLPDFSQSEVEVGTVLLYLGSTAPDGWLLCNGSTHPIVDYQGLYDFFVANGVSFGAPAPVGEFRLPDMRNRFAFGLNDSDVDFDAIGKTGGSDIHSHTASAPVNTHTHTVLDHSHTVANHTHSMNHTHDGPVHSHGAAGLVVSNNGDSNSMLPGTDRAASTREHKHNVSGTSGTNNTFTSGNPTSFDGAIPVPNTGFNSDSVRGATTGTTNTSFGAPSSAPPFGSTPILGSNGSDSVPPYYSLNYIVKV